ncbi:hypothetical protein TSUD_305990 [Trifolium subterraneum]|uniref:RRM domain-containing protein n=1 Tax=Trifolium subterraneum TaxID=3900 RepID=A0A2Z6LUP1_TRISU|nr:hypothetical protein TSUD_305990 [Trifolium subterraneum]
MTENNSYFPHKSSLRAKAHYLCAFPILNIMVLIPIEQLHLFHKMDRTIFSCLVNHCGREPSESLLIIALWLWLESIGFPSLILKLASFPLITINYVAQEAVFCLECLESGNFSILSIGGLLLTQTIMEREISLTLFKLKRGFPVTREEVRYLFTNQFGVYCIKNMRMGSVNSNGQVLYATIVMNNVKTFDRILNGRSLAKFHVNGKHIWARKYKRRE